MRLTRRAVLAVSSLAISRAGAAALSVERTGDGGFRVVGAEPGWSQTGAELRAALGQDVLIDVALDVPRVALRGTLAGEALLLDLSFGQSGGALTIAARGRFRGGPAFDGRPRPFPFILDERIEAGAFARALGLDPAGTTYLTIDAALGLRLVSRGGFALGQGLHVTGPLRLLPNVGAGARLAAIELPIVRGRRMLGQRGTAAFRLDPRPDRLVVVAAEGNARHLRLEGGGDLTIADVRLSYGPGSTVRFAATGSGAGAWRLDLLLPPDAQDVDTPEGRVELSGTGGSDIVAEGSAGSVTLTRAEARLHHVAHRLRLAPGISGFADLGRLDFTADTRVALATIDSDGVATAPGAGRSPVRPLAPTAGGRIPLVASAGPMRLNLDTACLWAARDADQFRARFGFRGLDLVVGRRAATLHVSTGGAPPTLIARLPPQHVMEEAFPRVAPIQPGRALRPEELPAAFDVTARERLQATLVASEDDPKERQEFVHFADRYAERYSKLAPAAPAAPVATVPPAASGPPAARYPSGATRDLERIWVGRDGLITPLGRRAARETAQAIAAERRADLNSIPLGLSDIIIADVLRRHGRLAVVTNANTPVPAATAAVRELLREAGMRQADLALLLREAARPSDPAALPRDTEPPKPLLLDAWRREWPKSLRPGPLRDALAATLHAAEGLTPDSALLGRLQDALDAANRSRAPAHLPVVARAAGETRLAFALPLKPGATLPWTLESLLDWGAWELRVSRRAESRIAVAPQPPEEPGGKPSSAPGPDPAGELTRLLAAQLGTSGQQALAERLGTLRRILREAPGDTETAIELPSRLILSPDAAPPDSGPAKPPPGVPRPSGGPRGQPKPARRFRPSKAPAAHLDAGSHIVPLWRADLFETPGDAFSLRAIHTPDYDFDPSVPAGESPDDDMQGPRGPLRHPERGRQAGQPSDTLFALDDFDRRQIVALSSLHGLPVLARRAPGGTLQTSQVAPPDAFRIADGYLAGQDGAEQALYVPRPLPTRLLRLTALGGSLDLEAPFVPPAPLRHKESARNIFDAYSVERLRVLVALGREVTTEVVYKGFLYPLGVRASLVKETERHYLPWPQSYNADFTDWRGPLAFQVQRWFIQIGNRKKTFPGIGQPFEGRAWPARALTMLTTRTPELLNPTRSSGPGDTTIWIEELNGRLNQRDRTGLVFWPRTASGESGNVRFRFAVDQRPEPVSMPLIFVDNQAAHDAPTMRALQAYWNAPDASIPNAPTSALARWQALRRLEHAGVPRRYAVEDAPGDTTFESLDWTVRVDSRAEEPAVDETANALAPPSRETPLHQWQMNSAMESEDQAPFYPRCLEATIRHDGVASLTGNPQAPIRVRFLNEYLLAGLPVLKGDELKLGTADRERLQATLLAEERKRAGDALVGQLSDSDPNQPRFGPHRLAYLHVIGDPPRQGMGSNGDRASGVMRPEMVFPFIGRKGPIGASAPALGATPSVPESVGSDFVLPDARILGLVSLQTLLKDAAAPLLRQALEYSFGPTVADADAAARRLAAELRSALSGVLARFDGASPQAQLLVNAYASALAAMRSLEAALDAMTTGGLVALPPVITAGRAVRDELERLAANPLGPLSELGNQLLGKARDDITKHSLDIVLGKLASLNMSSLASLFGVLVPLGDALLALDEAIAALNIASVQATALRTVMVPHLRRAATTATSRLFATPNAWPQKLDAVPAAWGSLLMAALRAEEVAGVDHALIDRVYAALAGVFDSWTPPSSKLPPPPLLMARIYTALRGAVTTDWPGAIRALEREGLARLQAWVGARLDGACTALGTPAAAAVSRLRDALLGTVEQPCPADACSLATAPVPALCANLWQLCSVESLRADATAVGNALVGLHNAITDFGDGVGDRCQPADVARLTDQLRRLDASRTAFGAALAAFLRALRRSAEDSAQELNDELAGTAGRLAAALLGALLPAPAAIGNLHEALEPALGTAGATAAVTPLRALRNTLDTLRAEFNGVESRQALQAALAKLTNVPSEAEQLADAALTAASDAATERTTAALNALVEIGRRAVADLVLAIALPGSATADEAARFLLERFGDALNAALTARRQPLQELCNLDTRLGLTGDERLATLLFWPAPTDSACPTAATDRVNDELLEVTNALNAATSVAQRAAKLAELVERWFLPGGAGSSVEHIVRNLDDRLLAGARRALLRLLDADALRSKLETELAKLLPTRRRFDYAWAAPPALETDLGSILTFKGGGFSASANATLDLLRPAQPLTGRIQGSVGDFDITIKMLGQKALTLFFTGVGFDAAPGEAPRISEPKLKRFEPSGTLLFLAGLAAYAKLKDGDSSDNGAADSVAVPSGIYTVPRPGGGAGLRAGYGLAFGPLQIGTMAFLDCVFDAHVELPFDGDAGHAQLTLSSPVKPCTLVAAPYGGSAYAIMKSVTRRGDTKLFTAFDVAFHFGAAVPIVFGPLQGSGRVMTGIRVFQNAEEPGFSALFVAAFEGQIACFGIAASFVVQLTYQRGSLQGKAALTYSFSVGPVKKSFTVHVTRNAGQGLQTANLEMPGREGARVMLAGPLPAGTPISSGTTAPAAWLRCDVPGLMQDWRAHRAHYANPSAVLGRRRRRA